MSLEAAEAVCGEAAIHALLELQECSLIIEMDSLPAPHNGRETEADPRYRMLEPLREYAWGKLTEMSQAEAVQRAHATYFDQMVQQEFKHYTDPQLQMLLKRLDMERDNLRAALAWCRDNDWQTGLSLAAGLAPYWHLHGLVGEGCQLLQQALAHPEAAAPTHLRGGALQGLSRLLIVRGELAEAQTCAEEEAQIWRTLNDSFRLISSLNNLGIIAYDSGDTARAYDLWVEMLAQARESGLKRVEAVALSNLGEAFLDLGQPAQARPLLEEALEARRALQDTQGLGYILNILGKTLLRLEEEAATTLIEESLQLRREINDQAGLVETMETVVEMMAVGGENQLAARLAGATQALRQQATLPRPANEEAQFANSLARVRHHLEPAAFAHAWKQGEALTWEQAAEAGLHYLQSRMAGSSL